MRPLTDQTQHFTVKVKRNTHTRRLDAYLAIKFPDYSRTFIQKLIRDGAVTVNGQARKPSCELNRGDVIDVTLPELVESEIEPEPIPLDVVYEDPHLLVINKPPHMVVHPARGHASGTLVNALLHYGKELSDTNGPLRPGIVHRLDRETSGVMLTIKDNLIHHKISMQFQNRTVRKRYVAIVEGEARYDSDVVDLPLGKHLRHREKMAVRRYDGKPATTKYQVLERFRGFTLMQAEPKTGRTHQIRLHMKAIGNPILCDALYGKRVECFLSDLAGCERTQDEAPLLARQALHAASIAITHPVTQQPMEFTVPVPDDMEAVLAALREHRAR